MRERTVGIAALPLALALVAPAAAQTHVPDTSGVVQIPGSGGTETKRRTIFLQRAGGTYVRPLLLSDNSSKNESVIVAEGSVTIAPFPLGEQEWDALVECVRSIHAPFDAHVTDIDPGAAAHIEVVVGGKPSDLHRPDSSAGVAPMYGDCSTGERAVAFVFAEHPYFATAPMNVARLCNTAAHEAGHTLGLDHSRECRDAMSYCQPVDAVFVDVDAPCGEMASRACRCGEKQNTVRHLRGRLGAGAADSTGPELGLRIADRDAGNFVTRLEAIVEDPSGIRKVEWYVDGELVLLTATRPFAFSVIHSEAVVVTAVATDGMRNQTEDRLELLPYDHGDGDGDMGDNVGCGCEGTRGAPGAGGMLLLGGVLLGLSRARRRPVLSARHR